MNNITFDEMFMTMAYTVALKSKDTSTKFGCIIVDHSNTVRSLGYNNFPRGFNDNYVQAYERPLKYVFTEHAERNAIYNASRIGVSLLDCRLYIPGYPCPDCARGIIQSGIKEVIIHKDWMDIGGWDHWQESCTHSKFMLEECGVNVRFFEGKILGLKLFRDGKSYDLNIDEGQSWKPSE